MEKRSDQFKSTDRKVIKLLLLGSGECGKSTIMKQMKILHTEGFSDEERLHFKDLIHENLLQSIQTVCQAMIDLDGTSYGKDDNSKLAKKILEHPESYKSLPADAASYAEVWADTGIQDVRKRSREYHLIDSAPYFLQECTKITDADYVPNNQDILRCRLATTGVHFTKFTTGKDKQTFRMYDVGGQRGERKKWIHCFENVTAILYVASLTEYDQVLAEDRSRNRLEESLALFEGVITLPWFKNASVILFLNKKDLFEEKILDVHIGKYHPAYLEDKDNKPGDAEQGMKFIQKMYTEKAQGDGKKGPERNIYVHLTTATNTENVAIIWKSAKHIILEKNLLRLGLAP